MALHELRVDWSAVTHVLLHPDATVTRSCCEGSSDTMAAGPLQPGADTVAQPDSANKTALANAARREKWIKVIVMSPG